MRQEQSELHEFVQKFGRRQAQIDRAMTSLKKEREKLIPWLERSSSIVFKRIDT
jgi:hypothetical protein